jgi:hypothetical protein
VDIQARQAGKARAYVVERGILNTEIAIGDVYALPFAAASFDAVFAHAQIEAINAELRAWGRRPDACFAVTLFWAVGRAGG